MLALTFEKLKKPDYDKIIFFLFLLIFFLFVATTLTFNHFTEWDSAGHLDLAISINEDLWPDYSGWNPSYYLGFQQGLYYPPLFHYILAGLLFILTPALALKLLVGIILALYPFGAYYFSKSICSKKVNARYLTIVIIASWFLVDLIGNKAIGSIGVGPESSLVVGLLPAFLFGLLMLFFFGSYAKNLGNKKFGWLVPTILLTICFSTHFLAFILILFLIICALSSKYRFYSLKILLTSILLSAYWWIPFILNLGMIPVSRFGLGLPPALIIILIISFATIFFISQKYFVVRMLGAFTFTLMIIFFIINFLGVKFQFNKLQSIMIIFAFVPIVFLALQKINPKYKKIIGLIFVVLMLFAMPLSYYKNNETTTLTPSLNITGRTLSLVPSVQNIHEFNISFANQTGKDSLVGLFSESSISSDLVLSFAREVYPRHPTWGVRSYNIDTNNKEILQKQIEFLNLDQVIGFEWPEKLDKNLLKDKAFFINRIQLNKFEKILFVPTKTDYFNEIYKIYFLEKQSPVFLPQSVKTDRVDSFDEWNKIAVNWFTSDTREITINTNKKIDFNYNSDAILKSFEISKNKQKYFLEIDSKIDVPILVKINWSNNWRAFDETGKELEVFLATPKYILINGKGKITLSNEKTIPELIGRILSLIALLLIIFICRRKIIHIIKKMLNKIKSIKLDNFLNDKKDWINFLAILLVSTLILLSLMPLDTTHFSNTRSNFLTNDYFISNPNFLQNAHDSNQELYCVFENFESVYLNNQEILFLDTNTFFYSSTRGEIVQQNVPNIINIASLENILSNPVFCEKDASEKNSFVAVRDYLIKKDNNLFGE